MRTVLIVEDEPLVLWAIGEVTRAAGYRVLQAATRQEALHLLRSCAVDVLLADVRLGPTESGLTLTVVARGLLPQLGIVLMTGWRDAIGDLGLMGVRFLIKPFTADELRASLEQAFAAAHAGTGRGAQRGQR